MANLKALRTRINSVKSTEKITSAMKMVAASRLRKAQQLIGKSAFYYNNLLVIATRILKTMKTEAEINETALFLPEIMTGRGNNDRYLLVVFASDRGLCGGYNINVVKETIKRIEDLENKGKYVKILCVGKKSRDILRRKHGSFILDTIEGAAAKGADYVESVDIFQKISNLMRDNDFGICETIYSKFHSALSRDIVAEQYYPLIIAPIVENKIYLAEESINQAYYDYEPLMACAFDKVLELLQKAMLYQAIINSQASEQGARMTSMDNATRNAKEMISKLTLKYNRIRQSAITTELTEIISGAEAI